MFDHASLTKLLENIPSVRIDYIEDPFMNKSEFIQFTKSNNLKVNFAFDENLGHLLSRDHTYDSVKYAIIKPNLIGGLSKTIEYTKVTRQWEKKLLSVALLKAL